METVVSALCGTVSWNDSVACRLESQIAAAALPHISLGKVREWLSLDTQQMSRVSWNLIESHMYIPEPITMAQVI